MSAERVVFEVEGSRIVGALHRPAGDEPVPAVVVAGPMMSVKEQVTGVYAAALARRGIAALAIDHRHYGESGGRPRQYERSDHKIADLAGAFDALEARPDIAAGRIGAVGVCLGAGYMAFAANRPQVRAFAAVAGYFRDVEEMLAKDRTGFEARVAQGRSARERYEKTGLAETIPAVALQGDAAMTTPELHDYYARSRAGVPNYVNRFAVMSREHFLPFDVQSAAPRITAPFLMIHSEAAIAPAWARRFFAAVTGPKAERWVEAAGQTEFYDGPRLVEDTADEVAQFLMRHLR